MSATRKTVVMTVTAVFEGEYHQAGELPDVIEWELMSLSNNDDYVGCHVAHVVTLEEPVDDRAALAAEVKCREQKDVDRARYTDEMIKIWRWAIDANNGVGGDVDDLIGILEHNGMPCPPELEDN